ncbi:MAG: hypothetical protein AAF383_17295, partial [Cyanobacteria bacterium P01_A01_bin.83]
GRPERNHQQSSSILQQAWNSIERTRLNITAAIKAIEHLEQSLTELENRPRGNTDPERAVNELESTSLEQSNPERRVEPIPDERTQERDFHQLQEQGTVDDARPDRESIAESEIADAADAQRQRQRNRRNHTGDFELDL